MAITLDKLNKGTLATVSIEYPDGDSLNIKYDANLYTPKVEAQFNEFMSGNLPAHALAKILSTMIRSWDVIDNEGNPVLPTAEIIESLGIIVLGKLVKLITGDIKPGGDEDAKN